MAGKGEVFEVGNGLYTPEQVEILEQVYKMCRKPSQSQRLEMINEYPYLSTLESKEIKRWFQNRRLHETQKKIDREQMILREKLVATKQLLWAENAQLQQVLLQLENENKYIRSLLQNASSSTTEKRAESACYRHSLVDADNSTRSFLLGKESHTNFLTVSKQSAIGWFPTPKMKALHCIVQLVEQKSGKQTPLHNKETLLLSFSQLSTGRLSALNGDGRSLMNHDAAESLIVAVNSEKHGTISSFTVALSFPGTILCIGFYLLLKKMDASNFKFGTDGEINVAKSMVEARDIMIAKSAKNLGNDLDVHWLMTLVNPGSTEASKYADWISEIFRSNQGNILLTQMVRANNLFGSGCGTSSFRAMRF